MIRRWFGVLMAGVAACNFDDSGLTVSGTSSTGSTGGVDTSTGGAPTSSGTGGTGTAGGSSSGTGSSGDVGPTTGPETTTTGGSSSTGPVDPSTGSASGETGGASCCAAQDEPGCGDAGVEACVCAADPFCCEQAWDGQCAGEVEGLGCGACGFMPELCCEPQRGPGCAADPGVAACVCASEPACCTDAWSGMCVGLIEKLGCGTCAGPPPPGPCCEAGQGPSCVDDAVATCVCAQQPECCSDVWSDACAAAVVGLGCGDCNGDPGMCCAVQPGPLCGDPAIEACVCGVDAFCCEEQWDDICVGEVEGLGCGVCQGMGGACCEAGMGPGCEDLAVAQCVCDVAPSCCDVQWSDACAALVEPLGCGVCGGGGTGCCEVHDGTGCDDQGVSDCVCAIDDFCCTISWDETCVQEVEAFGCGAC